MAGPYENREEILEEILSRIAEGETLRAICREPEKPSYGAVYDWLEGNPEWASRFTRAREKGADAIAYEALAIADDPTRDYTEDGAFNPEHIQRSKLRVETRLKLLAKWFPQKYGDKQQHEHSGKDGGPIQLNFPASRDAFDKL